MIRELIVSLLAVTPVPAASAPLASLIVKFEGVTRPAGDLRVALYTRESYAMNNGEPVTGAVVPAKAGETIVTLSGIKPGEYAVKLFHDANRNGQFDMNWLGMPLEMYGFSNDAHPGFSEPGFGKTRFELRPGTNTITIHLQ